MSPLNRGPLLGPRMPPVGMRQLPPPRFAGLPPHGMLRMRPPPLNPMFSLPGGPRQRIPLPPRPAGGITRPNGMLPRFPPGPGPRTRAMPPIVPSMGGPRGSGPPHGPPIRVWPRRMPPPPPPPQMMPPQMRFKYGPGNGNAKIKAVNNPKKERKLEELELKKPWMTDEIRNEIQKKNKLYAKAKKNKAAVEWEEFKDLRNKVTRMIREAKNEYLAKHPEQAHLYLDEELYNQRDENYVNSGDDADDNEDDENTSHYCEVCDRDFPSKDDLSEHKSTHITCGIDGCTFSAHPLLVEKHISMQHRTGLYQRMKDLSEDVEKWIMERKKKYPTENNIKLRKAEELEKLQRGEVIKQNSNAGMRTKKTINIREKKRRPRKRRVREINNSATHTDEIYRGLHPFAGITILQDDAVFLDEETGQVDLCEKIIDNISDEDDVPQASAALESISLPVTSLPILPSLVADYESENDEVPEEVPIKKIKEDNLQHQIMKNKVHEENARQLCKETFNKQVFLDTDDKSNIKPQNTVAKAQDKQNYETNQIDKVISNKNEKFLRRYHNKLLEKLLSRSIQHERNLICQCVKYIIENNFFDIN
ncbi:nuclear fragile X mental retardation-interacting protein 1 isoform X1 [Monomorium pharaonis]|uniref:nuclear fragile X mental retardation-interacting protein 1 isoform X1 n=1 Tax=Monomorium pharaonis TaxID=307658 RepID=UPI00063F5F22|nr:nuclear fragile X mental retardation-interacting protein 1 isoform X1 [Monomorium pharaonis]